MVRIQFVAYNEVVSGSIVELISVVIRQDPVGIAVVASNVVVGKVARDVVVARRAMVGVVFVVGLAIGGVKGIRCILL